MLEKFYVDYYVNTNKQFSLIGGVLRILFRRSIRILFLGRLYESLQVKVFRLAIAKMLNVTAQKLAIEISFEKNHIGAGLQLTHPYGITVNGSSFLDDNVTLYKGCTIGSVRTGRLKGVPTIGRNVVICANAFICGNIHVGNNVLIAANAFVDFDVPDDSIVIGNPGVIHHKRNMSSMIEEQRGTKE